MSKCLVNEHFAWRIKLGFVSVPFSLLSFANKKLLFCMTNGESLALVHNFGGRQYKDIFLVKVVFKDVFLQVSNVTRRKRERARVAQTETQISSFLFLLSKNLKWYHISVNSFVFLVKSCLGYLCSNHVKKNLRFYLGSE